MSHEMSKKHKLRDCDLPKANRKRYNLVAACITCHKLYVCKYRLYVSYDSRCGGYYYWNAIKGENNE